MEERLVHGGQGINQVDDKERVKQQRALQKKLHKERKKQR